MERILNPQRVQNPLTRDVSLIKQCGATPLGKGVIWKRDPRNQDPWGPGLFWMVQSTGKKFGSANKAVVVMVPRGGSPNHTADVGFMEIQ